LVGFPYTHLSSKITVSQSNCSGVENHVEVHLADISGGHGVFAIVLYHEVWDQNIRDCFPRKETISHAFLNLVDNIQKYNAKGI